MTKKVDEFIQRELTAVLAKLRQPDFIGLDAYESDCLDLELDRLRAEVEELKKELDEAYEYNEENHQYRLGLERGKINAQKEILQAEERGFDAAREGAEPDSRPGDYCLGCRVRYDYKNYTDYKQQQASKEEE